MREVLPWFAALATGCVVSVVAAAAERPPSAMKIPPPPSATNPPPPPPSTTNTPPPPPSTTNTPPSPSATKTERAPNTSKSERPPEAVVLSGPSVVVFHPSHAEIVRTEPEPDEEKLAFRKDFEGGATKLQQALKASPHIKVLVSSADVVRFADAKVPPVWRYSVGAGYGYVFYAPGKPLRVFSGVRSADGLICEAWRMFDTKPKPPHCDP